MSDIPSEVFREILLRLPAESLFRFKTVCKAWRRIIDDPSFIKSHTKNQLSSNTLLIRNSTGAPLYSVSLDSLNFTDDDRQIIDATPVKQLIRRGVPRLPPLPVASCNGLILISHENTKKIWAIWNPLTRECHELPQPNTDLRLMGSGLGYDYATDDYKVVRIDHGHGTFVFRTLVYSLKLGSWRRIKDCPRDFPCFGEGVFLSGALHWRSGDMIIALNLGTEDYHQLPMPLVPSRPGSCEVHLDALGGCLTMSYYYYMIGRFDGWVMNDYGVEKSWTKLFSFGKLDIVGAIMSRLRPVAYLKGKRQVLLQHDRGFFWLDVEDNSVKKVTIHGLSGISSSQICPGSLFRLDSVSVAANRTTGVKSKRKTKRKRVDTRLKFCVRDPDDWYCSDLSCCSSDSSWSSEGED